MEPAPRSVLITGCSSGIGLASAQVLRARGWRVLATCRKPEDVDRLRSEGFESFRLDYEDEPGLLSAADEALARTDGRLEAVFNNGAYAIPGFVEDLPTDALRAIFEANLFGWHTLTRRLLPAMRAHDRGRIVQCSSVLGFAPARWRGAYVASKHALEGLTDCLRLELRGTGIHISLIEPGPIRSRFNQNALAQFARWIDRESSSHAAELTEIEARYRDKGARTGPKSGRSRRRVSFRLPPEAVAARLVHALESPRPKSRYRVTVPTWGAEILRRAAPRSLFDAVMARQ